MSDEPASIGELVEAQADKLGEAPFLHFEDETHSFAALDSAANRVALGLASIGVGPGTGVAILMANAPEWLFTYIATQKLGAYAVPVNTALRGEGLRYVINHSGSRVLVIGTDCQDAVWDLEGGMPGVRHVVIDDTRQGKPPAGETRRLRACHSLAELAAGGGPRPRMVTDPDAISAISYTSGTTGPPKGVVTRYDRLDLSGVRLLGGLLEPDDILYTCLPLFHANALWLTTFRALAGGRPMVLARRFSAGRFWDDMRYYSVTTFNALGAMVPILMKQPERPDDAQNPVRTVFSAACPVSVWEAFERRFAVRIVEGYAAVDGGGYVTINFGQSPKGSIGKPASTFRIVDDNGRDVPAGEPGELIFEVDDPRRRQVEYYRDPAAGEARISGGWFHTGDLVRADPDGNLYFVDRKTESLRRRGENISSWEVERELDRHPAVLESAVFGVPSELGEHEVMAVVVPKEGCEVDAAQLVDFAAQRMAAFMVPRYVEIVNALPKTETHRVRKAELKQRGIGPATWDRESGTQTVGPVNGGRAPATGRSAPGRR